MSAKRKRNLKRAGLAAVITAIAALSIVAIAGGGSNTAHTPTTPSTAAAKTTTPTAPSARGSGPALTAAEYRQRANAICRSLSFTSPAATTSLQQAAPMIASDVAETNRALERLRALRPPTAIASQVNDALDITEQAVAVDGQIARAAQAGDQTGARSGYQQLAGLAAAEHGIWKQIGVSQC